MRPVASLVAFAPKSSRVNLLAGFACTALLLGTRHAAAAETMPQLDFGNALTGGQVLWGAVIFVLLFLALNRWALPQVEEVLQLRAAAVKRDLDAAHAAKAEADLAVAELTEADRAARATAQAEISKAVDEAKAAAAAQAATLNERLEHQLADAEARINAARNAAMGALREVAVDTTSALVSRLTGRPADAGRVGDAVTAALAARAEA